MYWHTSFYGKFFTFVTCGESVCGVKHLMLFEND